MQFTTVTLTAEVSGKNLVLLNRHGGKIAALETSLACPVTAESLGKIKLRKQWNSAFSRMKAQLANKVSHASKSAWNRKCATWHASLRWRDNRVKSPAKAYARCFSSRVRKDWSLAVKAMYSQYRNRLHEARKRKQNPWRLWAQTVSCNHRKKGNANYDCEFTEEDSQVSRNDSAVGAIAS